ncbi:MAG: M23 family metallopeptidase [Treponema sp.]|nr:M23 family metallopeptidase [Treponema sp.]
MNKKVITILIIIAALGIFMQPPVRGGRHSSWWGIRPGGLDGWFHSGSDIAHAVGTPVNPVAMGKVKAAGEDDKRGKYVLISHFVVIETRYYHLDSISTEAGESVNHKSVIGTLGNTGLSTGPHLHFEIRLFGIPLPAYFLTLPGKVVQIFFK